MEMLHIINETNENEYLFDAAAVVSAEDQMRHRLERLNALHNSNNKKADNKKAFDLGLYLISRFPGLSYEEIKERLDSLFNLCSEVKK